MFDIENVRQTAIHTKTRNWIHSEDDIDAIENKLIDKVIHNISSGNFQPGQMEQVYDVFFIIDKFPEGTLFNTEPATSNPPKYHANFFVRLGRPTSVEAV